MTVALRRVLLIAVMVVLVACSGEGGSVGTTPESTAPAEGSGSGGEGVGSTQTTDSVQSSTTTTVVGPLNFEIPAIDVTTPTSGEGPRPELSWEPVPETAFYLVTVYTPSGTPYWAWQGEKTSVHVGGEPRLEEDAAGPSVVEGMTWGVVAVGPDDGPLASSGRMEISP